MSNSKLPVKMAAPAPPIDLAAWDRDLAAKGADFEKLYQRMLTASKEMTVESAEVWWRLARITYTLTFNYVYEASSNAYHEAIKSKAMEACKWASKALLLEPTHFEANLWMAKCAGKVAILELNPSKQTVWIEAFLRALSVCILQKPSDPRVLYLEGRLQLSLLTLTDEQKAVISKNVTLPEQNIPLAESKLRRSIQQNPESVASYMTLALVLLEQNKEKEASEVVEAGLKQPRTTRSDEYVAEQLLKVKNFLLHQASKPKLV